MTRRALFTALVSVAGLSFSSRLLAAWKRRRDRQQFERLCAYGQARMRAHLRSEGLNPDRMTEEEIEEYVENAVDEFRREQRAKVTSGSERG